MYVNRGGTCMLTEGVRVCYQYVNRGVHVFINRVCVS